ncbi:MAG: glycoside hydrolase family 3 N-terminal domain-containing protein [Acidobacteriota bacterium]
MTGFAPASRLFGVGIAGAAMTEKERGILERFPPWGVILFRRNIETPDGVRSLAREISRLPGPPLLCIDQEGGPVDRFRDLFGRSISFHDAARAGLAREAGALAGEACRALGFNIDLAPVVDRDLPGASERFLAGRCASAEPEEIVAAATAFLEGLHGRGIAGCVKHFPGLGRGDLDTHQALPFLRDDPEEEAKDLAPFAATMDLAGAVMISHAAGPEGLPASLSPGRATALLRGVMGFTGASFSDDLEMGALASFGEMPDRCAEASRAGCDLLFVCSRILEYPDCAERVDIEVSGDRRREAAERLAAYARRAAERRAAARGPVRSFEHLKEATRILHERATSAS